MSSIGHIIEDSKVMLHTITEASYTYVRRQANGVAHRPARYTLTVSPYFWLDTPPGFIADILLEDVFSL